MNVLHDNDTHSRSQGPKFLLADRAFAQENEASTS